MEGTQFQNMDNWSGGSGDKFGLTFKQIILTHINRCVLNGSIEWHGGYWNTTGSNPATKTYVHNSREVYINSIKTLRALLIGYFDEEMEKIDEEYSEEMKNLQEEYDKESYDNPKDISELRRRKTNLHLELFEQLVMLSKRLNFFEETSGETQIQ